MLGVKNYVLRKKGTDKCLTVDGNNLVGLRNCNDSLNDATGYTVFTNNGVSSPLVAGGAPGNIQTIKTNPRNVRLDKTSYKGTIPFDTYVENVNSEVLEIMPNKTGAPLRYGLGKKTDPMPKFYLDAGGNLNVASGFEMTDTNEITNNFVGIESANDDILTPLKTITGTCIAPLNSVDYSIVKNTISKDYMKTTTTKSTIAPDDIYSYEDDPWIGKLYDRNMPKNKDHKYYHKCGDNPAKDRWANDWQVDMPINLYCQDTCYGRPDNECEIKNPEQVYKHTVNNFGYYYNNHPGRPLEDFNFSSTFNSYVYNNNPPKLKDVQIIANKRFTDMINAEKSLINSNYQRIFPSSPPSVSLLVTAFNKPFERTYAKFIAMIYWAASVGIVQSTNLLYFSKDSINSIATPETDGGINMLNSNVALRLQPVSTMSINNLSIKLTKLWTINNTLKNFRIAETITDLYNEYLRIQPSNASYDDWAPNLNLAPVLSKMLGYSSPVSLDQIIRNYGYTQNVILNSSISDSRYVGGILSGDAFRFIPKIENFNTTKTSNQNLADVQQKYKKINGVGTTLLMSNIIAEMRNTPGPYTKYSTVGYEINAPSTACGTQFEQVEANQAWDGSWYISNPPACPTGRYGKNCDISCEPDMQCENGVTDEDINKIINEYKTKKCQDTSVATNGNYCDNYTQWNPPSRAVYFNARTQRYAKQLAEYEASILQKTEDHIKKLADLTALLTNEHASVAALKVEYDAAYDELVNAITIMNAEIEVLNQNIKNLRETLIKEKIAADKLQADIDIAGLKTKLTEIQTRISETQEKIKTTQAKLDIAQPILDNLTKEYNILQANVKATTPTQAPTGSPLAAGKSNTTSQSNAQAIATASKTEADKKIKISFVDAILTKFKSWFSWFD